MTAWRSIAWDGLRLTAPAGWEPARLGLGYLLLEDASGPRLTLRWQRLSKPREPERVLKRLSRRKILVPSREPGSAAAAWLDGLPDGWRALPCSDGAGRGGDGVLFVIPGEELAVLAAPHQPADGPGDGAEPWRRIAASVEAAPSGAFSLYDVAGQAPEGFRLAAFAVQLGHFHFRYRSKKGELEFFRFAPCEVILRGKTLDGWASEVFTQTLGKVRRFEPGYFGGFPAARHDTTPLGAGGFSWRALAARVASSARFARAMAWRPDQARIFAVVARHEGDLTQERFEEVCGRYVVQAP